MNRKVYSHSLVLCSADVSASLWGWFPCKARETFLVKSFFHPRYIACRRLQQYGLSHKSFADQSFPLAKSTDTIIAYIEKKQENGGQDGGTLLILFYESLETKEGICFLVTFHKITIPAWLYLSTCFPLHRFKVQLNPGT